MSNVHFSVTDSDGGGGGIDNAVSNPETIEVLVLNTQTGKQDVWHLEMAQDGANGTYQLLLSKRQASTGRFVGRHSVRELVECIGED